MIARRRSKTAGSQEDQERVPSANLESPSSKCEPCVVRRSSRLRQRTSPYFRAIKADVPAITPSANGASRKRSNVRTANDGAKDKSSTRTRPPAKRKRKSSLVSPPVKSEVDAKADTDTEAVRVHGLAQRVNFYGLIQEIVTPNVFRLLVATCLLNQTKGRAAMPVFWELLRRWPDEHSLASADVVELTDLLQPIGRTIFVLAG